jgi:integrase/recombinase XerD
MHKNLIELYKDFTDECLYAGKLSASTMRGYASAFDLLIKLIPGIKIIDLTSQTMIRFFEILEKRERIVGKALVKRGVKRSTIATYWSKLNGFTTWLERHEYIKENPFKTMSFPNVEYADKRFVQKENLEKILTAIAVNIDWGSLLVKKRNLAVLNTFLYTGVRKSELLGLKLLDIDFERKHLVVRAEISKSKINRTIPLNSRVIDSLNDYLNERKRLGYQTNYLFVSNNSDRNFTEHGLKHMISKIARESRVNFHVHRLRHTFAMNLINNGSDISKVKQLMGHKDIRMTAAYLRCIPTSAMRSDVESLNLDDML